MNYVFSIELHDCNPGLNGSPCYNVGYYNYISIWPCYIDIHFTIYTPNISIFAKSTMPFVNLFLQDLSHGPTFSQPLGIPQNNE